MKTRFKKIIHKKKKMKSVNILIKALKETISHIAIFGCEDVYVCRDHIFICNKATDTITIEEIKTIEDTDEFSVREENVCGVRQRIYHDKESGEDWDIKTMSITKNFNKNII